MMVAEVKESNDFVASVLEGNSFNESSAFQALRNTAKEQVLAMPMPSRRMEYWKYTPIKRFLKTQTAARNNTAQLESISSFLIEGLDAHTLVFVDGYYNLALSTISRVEGCTVMTLDEAKDKDADALLSMMGVGISQGAFFERLNTSGYTSGMYLKVEKNTVIEKPIHIINVTATGNVLSQTKHTIQVCEGAKVKVVESHVTLADANASVHNNCVHIDIADNSVIDYYVIQDKISDAVQVHTTYAKQTASSVTNFYTFSLKGGLIRNNLNVVSEGTYTNTNMSGIYFGEEHNFIDNHTIMDHTTPHCESNEIYKGVLGDKVTAVFNGKVNVHQAAQKTNAFQQNNNILLTDDATVNSKPELEIYADDVKCSHGSTTGQLDEEAIFYLRSRGISEKNARKMIILAFLKEAIAEMPDQAIKNFIDSKIEARFGYN